MDVTLPVIAGAISTIMFGLSTLPMLHKAFQTKDLRSYSLGNIVLSNGGNIVHSVYVFHLPPGPIWLLHSFYLVSTGLMLIWYLRYEWLPRARGRLSPHELPGISSLSRRVGIRQRIYPPVPQPPRSRHTPSLNDIRF